MWLKCTVAVVMRAGEVSDIWHQSARRLRAGCGQSADPVINMLEARSPQLAAA